MPIETINYAVVTLTQDQVDNVVSLLEAEGMKYLAKWVKKNKDSLYADSPEKWKPYKNKTIESIIEQDSNYFLSRTKLILNLDYDNFSNIRTLNTVRVFFFDAISMYIEKYRELASRIDFACCDGEVKSCCLIINDDIAFLPITKKIIAKYNSLWPAVSLEYGEGCMNCKTYDEQGLRNFKNSLKNRMLEQGILNPKINNIDERYGPILDTTPNLAQD